MSRTIKGKAWNRNKREPIGLHVGPGGIGCSCCFPAPSSTARKILFRVAKRVEKRLALMEMKEAR